MNLVSCKSMHKILFALQFLLFLAFSAGANAQTISSLSPASGPVGVLVTITGTGFGSTQGSSTVSFDGTAASPCGTCWSATSISVLVPTGATTGNVVVTVGGVASNGVGFTVTALPSGWSDGDIGTVGQTGSSSYANGVFTVKGAGAGVTGTSDAFHFVYQPLSGNGTIVARVVSLQGSGSGYIYPAAGVMIRNSLASNDMSAFTDYYQASLNYNFVYRTTSGGSAGSASGSGSQTLPYWVMVVRNGSTFTSYIAMDGVNWVQVGTSQTISMAQNVYVGLGVTNGTTTALATATFDSVSVNSTANPGPVITSISATTGSVGSQVVITGTGFGATQNGSLVTLNNSSMTINSWSATSITITIPTGATSGPLLVSVAPSMNDSNPVEFTVTSHPLPTGWLDQDVGSVKLAGNASYANGVFTVQGAGAGITGTSDAFHFVYQPLSGNGTIVARVVSLQGGGSGYIYPAAGVMIRNSLTANDMSAFTDYYQASLNYNFVYRTTSGGSAGSSSASGNQTLPYWIMVVRNGSTFSSYIALDGVSWVQVGTSQTISMAQNVYVGLGVTNGATTALATATFDSVSVNSTANPGPVITTYFGNNGIGGESGGNHGDRIRGDTKWKFGDAE